MRHFVFKLSSTCTRQERVTTYFRKVFVAGRLKLDRLFLKRLCRTTRTWQEALQSGMWPRKRLHGVWQWCHLAARGSCVEGSWEARGGSTGTCSSHSVSAGCECRAGYEADVSTAASARRSRIRESAASTHNWYSCTICERLFSEVSASSSCHALGAPEIPAFWAFCLPLMAQQHLCRAAWGWRGL